MVGRPIMSESGPPDPLQRLGSEIDRVRARADDGGARRGDITSGGALGFGLRVGIELVAALIVGLGLGWLADHYLGTRPWGLIAGFFLGSAAGMVNAFRAVQGVGRVPPGGAAG
jgi:ATP synthase protein I